MFVILAGALLLGLPTLLLKQFQDPDAVVPRLLRGFAGGVIVALALVHIAPSVSAASSAPPHPSNSSSDMLVFLGLVIRGFLLFECSS
jgi:zinc transporter ZupT